MTEIERLKNEVAILQNASRELNRRVERLEEILLTGRAVIRLPGDVPDGRGGLRPRRSPNDGGEAPLAIYDYEQEGLA